MLRGFLEFIAVSISSVEAEEGMPTLVNNLKDVAPYLLLVCMFFRCLSTCIIWCTFIWGVYVMREVLFVLWMEAMCISAIYITYLPVVLRTFTASFSIYTTTILMEMMMTYLRWIFICFTFLAKLLGFHVLIILLINNRFFSNSNNMHTETKTFITLIIHLNQFHKWVTGSDSVSVLDLQDILCFIYGVDMYQSFSWIILVFEKISCCSCIIS